MSVRAHRINKIELACGPSFNLWHDSDQPLCNWLDAYTDFYSRLNADACGVTEVSVEDLELAIKSLGNNLDKHTKQQLKDDIAFAKKNGDAYVQYDVF